MKLSTLKLGVIASLLFHMAVLGGIMVVGTLSPPHPLPPGPPTLRITLMPDFDGPEAGPVSQTAAPPQANRAPKELEEIPKPIEPQQEERPTASLPPPETPVEKAVQTESAMPITPSVETAQSASTNQVATAQPQSQTKLESNTQSRGNFSPQAGAQSHSFAKPKYQKNPEPLYPAMARRRHQEGMVMLAVRVTAEGKATQIVVKKSSGFPLLDDAAIKAAENWEFEPARLDSTAIESEAEVPVRFQLTQ